MTKERKGLKDGRICVRTVGELYPQLREGVTLNIRFCTTRCPYCPRCCGKTLPHNGPCICGECDVKQVD